MTLALRQYENIQAGQQSVNPSNGRSTGGNCLACRRAGRGSLLIALLTTLPKECGVQAVDLPRCQILPVRLVSAFLRDAVTDGVSDIHIRPHCDELLVRFRCDGILLGEIRDVESARAAFLAAQSGHLVYSTLHTDSALETLSRLSDLGLSPTALATSLKAVNSQRLVRRVYSGRREATAISGETLHEDPATKAFTGLTTAGEILRVLGPQETRQLRSEPIAVAKGLAVVGEALEPGGALGYSSSSKPLVANAQGEPMQDYDWSQFHVRMYYLAPLDDVFRRFATAEGLESFFIHKATHTAPDGTVRAANDRVQDGDRYDWTYVHDFGHGGSFERVEPGRLVRFTFGSMRVEVRFRDLGDATEVDLHQTRCATTDPERAWQHVNCRSCWIYFMTNLRSVLAGGPDLRDHGHPNWNDSVSIGFDPDAGPGQPR